MDLYPIIYGACFLVLYLVTILVAKWFKDLLTPYDLDEHLTDKDNIAVAVSVAGYFAGVTIVYLGALIGPSKGLGEDLMAIGSYTLLGLLLLNLSRLINDKLILHRFSNEKELIEDHNAGTGAVVMGSYIASALIIAGAIHGDIAHEAIQESSISEEVMGVVTALSFFLLGQLVLILFGWLYEKVTAYKVHEEIEKDNTAAGLGFAGGLIAIGVIIMKGVGGDFIGWQENLLRLAGDIGFILVFLVIVRIFFDRVIIPRGDLHEEIARDKNIGAGLLEMVMAISFSVVLYFLI